MKRPISFLLTCCLFLALAACGGADTTADAQIEPQTLAISAKEAPASAFFDVPEEAWYAESVRYLNERGIMNGTGGGSFSPDGTLKRAMIATVLYRIAGEPLVTGEDGFSDTEPGAWYSDAVLWAAQNGVMEGIGGGLFGTNDPVTQEQLATILWRYAGEPQTSGTADRNGASAYATDAIRWARKANIINEVSNTFQPKHTATRAQIADMIYRYLASSTQSAETSAPTAQVPQTGWTTTVPAEYKAAA